MKIKKIDKTLYMFSYKTKVVTVTVRKPYEALQCQI